MAQKAVAGDEDKVTAEAQESFIKNLLIRCKNELTDTNDGVYLRSLFNIFYSLI